MNRLTTSYNYLIIILMIVLPILGTTSFNAFQIFLEILLWLLLIYGIIKHEINRIEFAIILVFLLIFIGSSFVNNITSILINFKLFGLFIFSLIYFNKVDFFPKKLLYGFLYLNVIYAILAKIFNFWIIESLPFFVKQDVYLGSRPVGLLGSPHATSNFLSLFLLYLMYQGKQRVIQLIIIFALYLYSSWTAVLALILNIIYFWLEKIVKIKINPYLFILSGLLVAFIGMEIFINFFKDVEEIRFYSLEIMAPMLFDVNYYKGIFSFFSSNHDLLILKQENTFADVGNELGIVKIIVEGGIILSFLSLYLILKRINYFVVFFIVTLFHYSFFINMPFIFFFAVFANKEIRKYLNQSNVSIT
jgi:hypothetical protein